MCGMFRRIAVVLACLAALAACSPAAPPPPVTYDLVIANGRVMDPESNLDDIRHVGISGGKIEAVSATPLRARASSTPRTTSSPRASSTCTSTGSRRSRTG